MMKYLMLSLLFSVLLCGCTHFEYAGQDFPARTVSQSVTVFEKKSEIPMEKYRIIGRGTLLLPNDLDEFDIRVRLTQEARKHGADAFCFIARCLVNTGLFSDTEEDLAAEEAVLQKPVKDIPAGRKSPLIGSPQHRKKLRIQLLFLLNRNDFEREMKLRDR